MPLRRTKGAGISDAKAIGLPGEPLSTQGSISQKYSKRPSTPTAAVARRTVRRSRLPDAARHQGRGECTRDVVGATPAASLSRRATRHTKSAPRDAAAGHEDSATKHDANDGATESPDECEKDAQTKAEGTNAGERTGSAKMEHEGKQTPAAGSLGAESSFLTETLTKVHSSKVWFVLLCLFADLREPMTMESFNEAVKSAIMLLYISKEEELSPWHLKSLVILALSEILQDEDYTSKRERLTHFIQQLFEFLMNCFSRPVAYSEGQMPRLGIETDTQAANNCEAALPTAEATDAPHSAVPSTEVECIAAPRQTLNRGNSSQSVETVVSSTALTLNPTADALLSDSPHSKTGELETFAFSSTSNQLSCVPWSTPSLPFDWINSEGNDAPPVSGMNCPPRLSGLEMHQEGLTTTTCNTIAASGKDSSAMNAPLSPRIQSTTPYIQQNNVLGVLPIPETTSSFTNKLTPPKLTDRTSCSPSVLQQTSICQGRTMAFVRNNSATGILPPSTNSSALNARDQEALNNVLLLVSGQNQFLVLPNNGLETRLMQLEERNTSTEASDKGTAIPLSAGLPPSDKQSLPIQTGSNCTLQDPIPLPFLEPLCTKKRTRVEETASQIENLAVTKKLFSMSQLHRAERGKNQRLIKCLLTSGGQPGCSLFYISGFVDNDIWLRLPATIAITQFEDKTAFEQRSKEVKKLALKLDEQVPSSQAVPQLYEQNLVAIAALPGINLIVVPTYMEPHLFDIEVFVASTTVTRPVETPSSSSN